MYPPLFAGKVDKYAYTDDDRWEDDMIEVAEPELEPEIGIDEKPQKVSEEELAALDREALQVELDKLRRLGVIEDDVPEAQCDGESKFADLTTVCDWRFRQEACRRRCRIVASEFRQQSGTNFGAFSPTSEGSVIRIALLFHLLFFWKLRALDIQNAF